MRPVPFVLLAVLAPAIGAAPAVPSMARAASLMDAVGSGTPSLDLRYRYESVDQDGFADRARASTVRTRLGYTTGAYHGVRALVEFENVATVEGDEYDSTTNGKTSRPVVADPEGSELNRAALSASVRGAGVTLGRQRIVFEEGRFVGNVGFRQNEQTYDAVRLDYAPSDTVRATYAYLWRVNDITFRNARHDTHLVHVGLKAPGAGTVTAYGYFVNNDDAPATGSQTVGLRYTGEHGAGRVRLATTLEYAGQSEYAGSGIGSTNYLFAELSGTVFRQTVKLGYEMLGGDDTDAFQTPLATKHAFNGWADRFLTTPPDGLSDWMVTLAGNVAGVQLSCVHHVFASDDGSTDYGTETDLQAVRAFGPHTIGIAYASYNADAFATDTEKVWLFAGTAF